MRVAAALCLLILAGCDQVPAAGRYQMVSTGDGGVYVLDTRDGTVALCRTEIIQYRTWCGAKGNAAKGEGPPS